MIVSTFDQCSIRRSSKLDGILVGDNIIGSAVEDDRVGANFGSKSPFLPGRAQKNQFALGAIEIHRKCTTARATDDHFWTMLIELAPRADPDKEPFLRSRFRKSTKIQGKGSSRPDPSVVLSVPRYGKFA